GVAGVEERGEAGVHVVIHPAVPVLRDARARGVAAGELPDDALLGAEERRAGRARLRRAELPLPDAEVRPVRVGRVAEIGGDRGRVLVERDALLVHAGVVDGDVARSALVATVPAGEVDAVLGRDWVVGFEERPVRAAAGAAAGGAAEDGARAELVQRAVAGAAALGRAGRAARRVLEVPVDHDAGGVTGRVAAVVRGEEIGRA